MVCCDTIELLLRFLVILGLNDLKEKNKLNEKILKQFWEKLKCQHLVPGWQWQEYFQIKR